MPVRFTAFLCATGIVLATPGAAQAGALGTRPLARGAAGPDVKALQRALTKLGFAATADGHFGKATVGAVRRYERSRERHVDGRVTRHEGRAIAREASSFSHIPAGGTPPRGSPVTAYAYGRRELYRGLRGQDVREAQRLLTAAGFATSQDGDFGPGTEASVRAYELRTGHPSNGRLSVAEQRQLAKAGGSKGPRAGHVFPIRGSYSYGAPFGERRTTGSHKGQDIAAPLGTPIVSTTSGTVSVREYQAGAAGNYVVVRGDDGWDHVYMHMRDPALVRLGARVTAGQRIGYIGATGRASGPHLHFELWTAHWYAGGQAFDPLPYLRAWTATGR